MAVIDLDDFDAYEAFYDARPADRPDDASPRALASYRERILDWLVGAGWSQQGIEPDLCHEALAGREPVRLFILLEDYNPGQASVVVLVDSSLTAAQRAAFDRLGSACFEASIERDLRQPQLAGGLLAMGWFFGANRDELERKATELADALGELTVDDILDSSTRRGDLNAPIVACHTLRLAM